MFGWDTAIRFAFCGNNHVWSKRGDERVSRERNGQHLHIRAGVRLRLPDLDVWMS